MLATVKRRSLSPKCITIRRLTCQSNPDEPSGTSLFCSPLTSVPPKSEIRRNASGTIGAARQYRPPAPCPPRPEQVGPGHEVPRLTRQHGNEERRQNSEDNQTDEHPVEKIEGIFFFAPGAKAKAPGDGRRTHSNEQHEQQKLRHSPSPRLRPFPARAIIARPSPDLSIR